MSNSNDNELWLEFKNGSKDALEAMFYKYYSELYRYAVRFSGSRQIAEDHIQSLYLNIWERREYLGEVVSVKTYLWTALRRSIISNKKKLKREQDSFAEESEYELGIHLSAEEIIIQKEWKEEEQHFLYRAIESLNSRQKEILYLKYFEGLSYDEIEKITSLNYQTIRNYVYESIKVLKKFSQK